jgi:hypothetical protein
VKASIKNLRIFVILCLLAFVASRASAQSLKAQFDEWGNGTDGSGVPLPAFPGTVEPVSGMPTLMYRLPWPVTSGDLIISGSNGISDLIRFDSILNTAGTLDGVAYFFSDLPEPGEFPVPPADVGIPPPLPLVASVPEIGPEGNNFATYFAFGTGAPGSVIPGGLGVAYTIISDSQVPEPSTFVLLGMSGLGLAAYAWRKKK